MQTFFLVLHVVGAVAAFGPTFAFPILGMMMEREPAHAHALARAIGDISSKIVIPGGIVQALTGVVLLLQMNLNLSKNAWLGAGIFLYIGLLAVSVLYQLPKQRRLLALLDPARETPAAPEELKATTGALRIVGILMTVCLLVIIVLMTWKPGLTL